MGNFLQKEQISSETTTNPSWRGCASKFPQPITPKDVQDAQSLVNTINNVNCNNGNIKEIIYRTGEGEKDILRQVFRWDIAPYNKIFKQGLQAQKNKKQKNPNKSYYNLSAYVNGSRGKRPLDSRKNSSFAFISTTVSNSWYPPVPCDAGKSKTIEVYRYEIYAPGGIWTSLTLDGKNNNKFKRFDEVAFVGGIAPQYIRSAQLFRLTGNSNGTTTIERADNVLLINGNFNPQSHPLRLLKIENPVSDCTKDKKTPLTQSIIYPSSSSTTDTNIINWYACDAANRDIYLSATFRSSCHNEAYYILQNCVTLLNYDPGGTHDHIVDGPCSISKMFKSLEYTPFGEHGIDGAMQSNVDEAFIFCANLCVLINYAPSTKEDKIVKGPMTITKMFPFLKGTVFENGIDSATEIKGVKYEAYLFKGNLCAHISYGSDPQLIALGQICQFFPLLKGTVFDGLGIDAAYASHANDEVTYFFKYNNYGQINVNVDDGVEYLLGVWVMGANAPVIHSFVPQKNRGLDMRGDPGVLPNPEYYDHDEL
ncbi:hypothetical protein BVRB_4g072020 [Beta vulgaris subsp. vulgaris]|nr:hypothetical protein BVRB_4g072020 [Beta vulgaris subsp. vulgaris]